MSLFFLECDPCLVSPLNDLYLNLLGVDSDACSGQLITWCHAAADYEVDVIDGLKGCAQRHSVGGVAYEFDVL